MKKIIALMLILCCVFALFSCGANLDAASSAQLEKINEMLATSIPTKSETVTTHTIGNVVLESTATLVTGRIGGKAVSVYESVIQELAPVENDLDHIKETEEVIWYMEGKGVSDDNGGSWDEEGEDFAPKAGSMLLNLKGGSIKEGSYDEATETLVLVYDAGGANGVVGAYLEGGEKIESDLKVTIVTNGGSLVSIKLEYTIPSHDIQVDVKSEEDGKEQTTKETITVPEAKVTIEAKYEYDIQTDISLG